MNDKPSVSVSGDNEICGGCGAHFDTEQHNPDCPNNSELCIPLPNGGTLRCGSEGEIYGSDVRICDAKGNEILYWECTEWGEDPEVVMGAIFGASLKPMEELLKDRVLEDGCWVYRKKK